MTFVATPDDGGSRLDVWLARRLPDLSRSHIQRLIREGRVQTGGRPVKPGWLVKAGTHVDVEVPPPVAATPAPEPLPLAILYEDDDLAVIDKPAGLVVHPAPGHARGTLVNALLHHVRGLSGVGGVARPGVVHRLDRDTSGVMVVAKHDRAHRALADQFRDRLVGKEYLALVWGTPRRGQTIDRPIGRDPRHRHRMSSRAKRARPAVTRVIEVEPLGGVSLARVTIGTGRTHQIRVHLSESGHAIVGDAVYGGKRRVTPRLAPIARLARPFLHAARLTFAHPSNGRTMTIESPLPPDLASVLEALRSAAAG